MGRIDATARGSGPYIVFVDGMEYSRHTTEREAMENATEALDDNPTASVHYTHDYTVDVRLVDAPAPPPAPDIDPVPDPDPTPDPVVGTIFRSTWGTALGQSREALRDGGMWADEACMSPLMAVMAGDAIPAPAPPAGINNVLRVEFTNSGACRNLIAHLQQRGLQRGQSYWLRWYYRCDTASARSVSHYDTIDVFGYRNLVIHSPDATGGRYRPTLRTEPLPYPLIYWNADGNSGAGPFFRNTWYRLEYHVEILANENDDPTPIYHDAWTAPGQLEYRIWPRIYEGHGTEILADASNFSQQDFGGGNGAMNLAGYYAANGGQSILTNPGFVLTGQDALDDFTRVGIGNNGQNGVPSPDATPYYYYADYTVSTEGWIGPMR